MQRNLDSWVSDGLDEAIDTSVREYRASYSYVNSQHKSMTNNECNYTLATFAHRIRDLGFGAWMYKYLSHGEDPEHVPYVRRIDRLKPWWLDNLEVIPKRELKRIYIGGTGSRSFSEREGDCRESYLSALAATLTDVCKDHPDAVIVSGMARGFDMDIWTWAIDNGFDVKEIPAKWDELGRGAGYIRNAEIVKASDVCVSAYDGVSKGTAHALKLFEKNGVPITMVDVPPCN